MDNGEEIHRKVHTLKENGTDTDVVAASGKKAKDIVGLKRTIISGIIFFFHMLKLIVLYRLVNQKKGI